jgi:type III restriction enzyme
LDKNSERVRIANETEQFLKNKECYVFDVNYGTDQEKACVEFVDSVMNELNENFDEIFLIRNEQFFKIYSEEGKAFAPDFVLFMKCKNKDLINYQLFIEPKGEHLIPN